MLNITHAVSKKIETDVYHENMADLVRTENDVFCFTNMDKSFSQ